MIAEPSVPALSVVEATTPALVKAFIELPYRLYAADPRWVPELRRDAYRRISLRHNPFLEHAAMTLFVAVGQTGDVCGRIAAIEDRAHNETHRERVAWFGFLEATGAAVTRALLAAVEAWAAQRHSAVVRGPANPSLNESAGLLVDGFDEMPYLLMPFNPPVYAGYVESAGYRKAKDLWAWDIDLTQPVGERISRLADRSRRRHGVVIRTIDLRAYDEDLMQLMRIYREAWAQNWGFVAPTDAEVRQFAIDVKPIVDPNLVLLAEVDGRVAGCAVGLPDVNQVLARMGGRLLPFGLWHFLNRRRIIDRLRVALLGVLPEFRRFGLYPLLVAELHTRATEGGYRRAELSWTLEDNAEIAAGIEAAGGRHHKTYRLYDKPIG